MEINETIQIFSKRLISQLLAILFYDLFLTLPYCTISKLSKKQGDPWHSDQICNGIDFLSMTAVGDKIYHVGGTKIIG